MGGGPGGLAQRHCMASIRNTNYYELGLVHPNVPSTKPPIYDERRWLDELDSVDANGCVDVPDGPGLGVTLDRVALARCHRRYCDEGAFPAGPGGGRYGGLCTDAAPASLTARQITEISTLIKFSRIIVAESTLWIILMAI